MKPIFMFIASMSFVCGIMLPHPPSSNKIVLLPNPNKPHLLNANGSNIECDGCKWFIGKIQNYLINNEPKFDNVTINMIETNICDHLHSEHSQCNSLVEKCTPIVLDSLIKKIDPMFVCDELELCSETRFFSSK